MTTISLTLQYGVLPKIRERMRTWVVFVKAHWSYSAHWLGPKYLFDSLKLSPVVRCLWLLQDKNHDDFNIKTDQFNLKDCIVSYLKNHAKRDNADIQVSFDMSYC